MPSPRAVLRDINDLKLDPTKAHRSIKASGRLAVPGIVAIPEHEEVQKLEKPLKSALVELPLEKVEQKVLSAEPASEHAVELAADVELSSKKPLKPGKKKSEEPQAS